MQNDTIIPANANRVEIHKYIFHLDMKFTVIFFSDADEIDIQGFAFKLTNIPQQALFERDKLNRFNEQFRPITGGWDKVVMTDKLIVYVRPDVLTNV